MIWALAALAIAPLAAVTATPAEAKLPKPRSMVIVPGASVGAMRLGARFAPARHGWTKPVRCREVPDTRAEVCAWARSLRSIPVDFADGISGPYLIGGAWNGTVEAIVIGAGRRDTDAGAMRRWRTPQGIRLGASVEALRRAYPAAVAGELENVWTLAGKKGRTSTSFSFTDGKLNFIQMEICNARSSC